MIRCGAGPGAPEPEPLCEETFHQETSTKNKTRMQKETQTQQQGDPQTLKEDAT